MRFIGDYHTHTRYSDGRATMEEMVAAARDRGLEEIGITDHGPNNIGVGVSRARTFLRIRAEAAGLNEKYRDIRVLVGAEADVISPDGDIDVPRSVYEQLDLLLVGLHPYVLPGNLAAIVNMFLPNSLVKLSGSLRQKAVDTNTKALVQAICKHNIRAVTHPGLTMPVDVREVARACYRNDTAFEVNVGHNFQSPSEIRLAAREGVRFMINSDAHFPDTVGRLEAGLRLVQEAGVPLDQIVNLRC